MTISIGDYLQILISFIINTNTTIILTMPTLVYYKVFFGIVKDQNCLGLTVLKLLNLL